MSSFEDRNEDISEEINDLEEDVIDESSMLIIEKKNNEVADVDEVSMLFIEKKNNVEADVDELSTSTIVKKNKAKADVDDVDELDEDAEVSSIVDFFV